MPLMRIAVCFDGRITIHDHIPTNTLIALPAAGLSPPYLIPPFYILLFYSHSRIGISNNVFFSGP